MPSTASNPIVDRPLSACLASDADLERYIFPITDATPASLLESARDEASEVLSNALLEYIQRHRVQEAIARFEGSFCERRQSPATLATILRSVRHYHNGLCGGLLYIAGKIMEDIRLHRSARDRVGAAGPLFAAFDEFTDNPKYVISIVEPLLNAILDGSQPLTTSGALATLAAKGLLRRDAPHLERFYGVVDELRQAGSVGVSSDEMDQENPLEALPEKAVNAYQARRILTTRPDLSYAMGCAFMFGNETIAGSLYGKLYKGFRKYQSVYGLSDHACDYFGDHASLDGEEHSPAFEASHAHLMYQSVLMYGRLGRHCREQILKGLHLFLETYTSFVESLCEVMERDTLGQDSPRRDVAAHAVELQQ
jgi:hypothetical protein